jgi:hypothetical protein
MVKCNWDDFIEKYIPVGTVIELLKGKDHASNTD